MAVVKGSQQDQLVIRHYQPWQRFRQVFLTLLAFISVGVGGYFSGVFDSRSSIQQLTGERDSLQGELLVSDREITRLTQRVGVLEKGGEVDRKATEGIRQTVKELKAQISTLEEEVTFYKGIMAPSNKDKGLRISKIAISTAENGQFKYSIMMTQVADNSSFIAGLAAVNFVGTQAGKKVILPLRDMDSGITELGVKFRFRYFQEVTGNLTLPAQFIPEQVQVVLQSTGSKAQRVEQSIEWPETGEA